MKYCPITYEKIAKDQSYSKDGLKLLSKQLKQLKPLDATAEELRNEAIARAGKMSIQGVQPKLAAKLNIKESVFQIVDQNGQYILKPQSNYYSQLPENEAVSMSMAAVFGLEVPVHGLIYDKDNSMTYFIKRFDRDKKNQRYAVEDFAQLSSASRDTKYDSSMEKIAKIVLSFCSFPKIEAIKLFKLTLFNFLIGNEDMHLKNFSLIVYDKKICLSPAYDLLNSTIAQKNTTEEMALPMAGKKSNFKREDFLNYFAIKHLLLNQEIISNIMNEIKVVFPKWQELIGRSFLSQDMKKQYLALLEARSKRLLI